MHAALAALLSRYSGNPDVPIGTAVAGRGDPQLDDVVGMFASTLVLRATVDPTASFTELLAQVHERDIAAYTHADMPFETLVELLNPPRSASHHPLFQVALSMQRHRPGHLTLPGLTVTPVIPDVEHANFDLQLTVAEPGPGEPMALHFGYNAELYDHATVVEFAAQLVRFLEAVTADPDISVGDVDLLSEREHSDLVPAAGPRTPGALTLRAMITRGAQVAPDAVAVRDSGTQLTYRELDARSDVVARALVDSGVRPGDCVVWSAPRSTESVVRLWAIAKAGAAPVLIDPALPEARVAVMRAIADSLPRATGTAYVVFTSGTTGTPKAVVVTDSGLGALDADVASRFGAAPGARVLHRAAAGFDMTLLEVLIAGASGATLVIASDTEFAGPALGELLRRERITHACITPTVLATVGDIALPDLEVLMVGGERLGAELVDRWAPGRRLINGYGPAESTMYTIATRPLSSGAPVTIGTPIPGVAALVLDERLRPVPVGVPGELYLSGGALARGYAEQPGLTAERFVAGPDGTRLYRTGDLVRWRGGDELEYMGRNDSQVKIRGVRVEPGEIDAAIARVADVDFAATIVRPTPTGSDSLVSYVLPRHTGFDADGLRRRLAELLPSYLVPTAVVVLDSPPQTINGKLDLRSLPTPELGAGEHEPPATDTERAVAAVFAEVLELPEAGRGAHFFDAGGNSLLATQLTARLSEVMGRPVPLRSLFAHPTIAELATVLDGAVPEPDLRPALVSQPRPDRIPLSRSQYRMWALNRRDPSSAAYNQPATLRLDGPLDVPALSAALADVVARHEVLRTQYPAAAGELPHQQILPAGELDLTPQDTHPESVESVVAAFASEGFDLTCEMPLRVRLLQIGPDSHVLAVVLHHIAADGWSLTPLVTDVLTAYDARRAGDTPDWAPLSIHFADYALWEQELLRSEYSARGVEHWRRALDGAESGAALIPDRRPSIDASDGAAGVVSFRIPGAVQRAVHRLAHDHRATPFMVLHAALSVLLSRLGAQRDVTVATAVAGRGDRTLDPLVGMFVNTLALRAQVQPDMPFAGLLAQVRDFDVDAFEHADVPFESIADLLGGRTPQVALAVENLDLPAVDVAGLRVEVREVDTRTAKFDLHVTVREHWDGEKPGGMDGAVAYAADLFDRGTAASLATLLGQVLDAVTLDPQVMVGGIVLAPAPPLTGGPADDTRTLTDILLSTAAVHPDRPALTDGTRALTYRELAAASELRAGQLRAEGTGPGTVVEICMPRSIDFVIELWAVTRTGATFLPLDPTHPGERREAMVAQAQESAQPSVAYIIYTSGSTGTPKGVAVTHRGLGSLADEAVRRYRVHPEARVLHGYNPTFDAALLEMLLAFRSGACLVVAPPDVYGGTELQHLLTAQGVTHYLSTPSVLATLEPRELDALQVVAVGGEPLSPEQAAAWSEGRLMLNAYGPTESTVVATLAEVGADVTIGTPVPGTTAAVLDDRLRPVPLGGVGELYLEGLGLALGYVADPALTAANFVAGQAGIRRYRTGDVVHRRVDGTLSYVGRADRQVKVRGMRIEPAEVEAALLVQPGVTQAVVLLHHGRLVAFVTGAAVDPEPLRAQLIRQLPAHLVPQSIMIRDSLPLTSNGKLDVRALEASYVEIDTDSPAPLRTMTGELVAGVFATVLGGVSVGAHSNFFDIGGDSLSATAVTGRLSAAFRVDVPVRTLFEHPTAAGMAGWLDQRHTVATRIPLAPRDPAARIPLSPAQQRMWLLHRVDPSASMHHLVFVHRLGDDIDLAALRHALADVVQRHAVLRTVFPMDDSGPHQVIVPVNIDLRPVHGADVSAEVAEFVRRPFDLESETPLRVQLWAEADGDHVLAAVVHHIALDGGSMERLATDLEAAYTARCGGREPQWEPLPVDYADYSVWLRGVLGDPADPDSVAHAQLDYWTRVLDGVDAPIALPTDRPRPAQPSHTGATVEWTLDPEVRQRLSDVARSQGATVFMVLHAALAVLLSREGGHPDVVIGTAVAGRPDPALDALVGMFVGTVALRTEVNSAATFAALLQQVRSADLDAFAHADVPFDDVVARMAPRRSTSYNPLFQVMLAYQHAAQQPGGLPGTEAVGATTATAEFDLVWDFTESSGELTLRLLYATDLFDDSTARALAQRFDRILGAALTDPSAVVGDIDILEAGERAALVSGPARNYQPKTLAEIFETQVRATPHAVAVEDDGAQWTYEELDDVAERWARALSDRGVEPEDVVAVATGRGRHWVAAVWAVAKAGAVWLSLDPTHPTERLEWMLADSGAVVGLTVPERISELPSTIPWLPPVSTYQPPAVKKYSQVEGAAYVIYTSGTTGTPKGVVVPHRGLVNVVAAQAPVLDIDGAVRVLQLASPTFDASLFEMLYALSSGGSLVIAPDFTYAGDQLADVVRRERITHLVATPTVLATLDADSLGDEGPRTVVSVGERLPSALATTWASRHRLFNAYGPTEFTILASVAGPLTPAGVDDGVDIGDVIDAAAALVLDSRLHPVPDGVTGELYLSGSSVARGYLGRRGLTATQFVPNPYGKPGDRMYRTGDLVRRNAHGALDYLGRNDAQVQLHGIRVEPAEVDVALARHSDVRFVITTPVVAPGGQLVLVSYVVMEPDSTLTARTVREFARAVLPRHLVPSAVVVLDSLPVLPSGKVDRSALPEPEFDSDTTGTTPPSGYLETVVADVMANVIGVVFIGTDQDFFALGGTSMGAVAAADELRTRLGRDVPLQWLFTDPTAARLAKRIESGTSASDDPFAAVVRLGGEGDGPPLFCIHPAAGIAWCYTGLAEHLPGRVLYGVQATGDTDLPSSIAELAARHIDAIRTVQPTGPYHLLGWSLGGTVAQEMAVQLHEAGHEVATLAMLDTLLPEHRAALVNLGDNRPELDLPAELGAAVPADRVRSLGELLIRLEQIASTHQPRHFGGDAVFFTAAYDLDHHPELVPDWRRHFGGDVTEHRIDAVHADMVGRVPVAVIGRRLRGSGGHSGP
nr:non-ribosomal peptide synthetase [Rhodococcus opacus]